MQFGDAGHQFGADWEAIGAYIGVLEGGRWSSRWIADHFVPRIGDRHLA